MKWLLIFLSILKFIGIAVLILLALILLTMFILLLTGIKYEAKSSCDDGNNCAEGFISYVFGLIRFSFRYEDKKLAYGLNIGFIEILGSEKKPKKVKTESEKKVTADKKATSDKKATADKQTTADRKAPSEKKVSLGEGKARTSTEHKSDKKKVKRKRFGSIKRKKSNRKSKRGAGIKARLDMAISIAKKYDIRQLIAVTLKFCNRFIKALGIKQLSADTVFGFDDPSTTGLILGGASVVAAFLPFRVGLRGYFDGKYFEINGILKGKTNLLRLLIPVVVFIMEKPVWKIITNKRG
jgi:hypothetical protein